MIERVGRDVERELGRFGTVAGLAPLVELWPRAVGPEIARNAWPARVARDGTLHVNTSSSAWAFELAQLEQKVRASLGHQAPPRLRFTVGPLPEPSCDDVASKACPVVHPQPEHIAEAHSLTAKIGDENLRKIVAKAAALSLANADSDR
jgi:Dna[CI] antecedent, DciA